MQPGEIIIKSGTRTQALKTRSLRIKLGEVVILVNGEMNTGCSYKFVRRVEIISFRVSPNWTLQLIDAQIWSMNNEGWRWWPPSDPLMNSGRCLPAIYSKHRIYYIPSNWLIKPRKATLFFGVINCALEPRRSYFETRTTVSSRISTLGRFPFLKQTANHLSTVRYWFINLIRIS